MGGRLAAGEPRAARRQEAHPLGSSYGVPAEPQHPGGGEKREAACVYPRDLSRASWLSCRQVGLHLSCNEKVGSGKTGLSKIRSLYLVRKAESFLVPSASKAHELSTGTHRLPGGYFTEVYASRS